jgi:uncharacterized protein DUF5671
MMQRRLYLYIVAAASLGMLVIGLVNLGTTAVSQLFGADDFGSPFRDRYATFGALTLVGLPVWALHWWLAQRLSRRQTAERSALLRRLYLYGVLGALLVATMIFARGLISSLVTGIVAPSAFDSAAFGSVAWQTVVLAAAWGYHLRVAAADRAAVGETGGSATLRRWYVYGAQLLGLFFLLFGTRDLLRQAWVNILESGQVIGTDLGIGAALASAIVGLAVFIGHDRWTSRGAVAADDRHATLRAVAGFLAVAASVGLALAAASQLLYYALARVLGVSDPGGVGGDLLIALAGPASTAIVFTASWIWLRRRLSQDAAETEAMRQAGVRRLYLHLIALLALITLAVGAGGLLWTLSDRLLSALLNQPAAEWRNGVSLFVTLAVVGLPAWLAHWRPNAPAAERQTLSRRLYVYAVLLVSVLTLLGGTGFFVYRLLSLVLGTSDTSATAALELGRAFAVMLVAAAVGFYHWRILQADGRQRAAAAPERDFELVLSPSLPLHVEIRGATEEQVRQILSRLPEGATYSLTREDVPGAKPPLTP